MIRNFIYLNNEKLRSLSSQIFEGFTESVISNLTETTTSETSQKGPINSGRLVADIFTNGSASASNQYLYDHAYALLEAELFGRNMINDLSTEQRDTSRTLVKAKGKLRLNDLSKTAELVKDFNNLGLALWRTQNIPMLPTGESIPTDSQSKVQATKEGLQFNEKAADAMAKVMSFSFGNLLEVILQEREFEVSSPLDRAHLRESVDSIVHKYSRSPDHEFSLIGFATRENGASPVEGEPPEVKDTDTLRSAMRTLSRHIEKIEETYTSIGSKEIVVDPIAIYIEVPTTG